MATLGAFGGVFDDKKTWGEAFNPIGVEPPTTILGESPSPNNYPGHTAHPITTPLKLAVLFDGDQLLYKPGALLLGFRTNTTVRNSFIPVYAPQNLNYYFERKRIQEVNPPTNLASDPNLQKKQRLNSARFDQIPSTVEEFMQRVFFLGVLETSSDKENIRTREIGLSSKGKVTIPNIFKNHENGRSLTVGDTVYLVVKKKKNTASCLLNFKGQVESREPTIGSFLQIEGYWEVGGRNPIRTTDAFNPKKMDIDTGESENNFTMIEQKEYPVDPDTGLTLFDSQPKRLDPIHVKKYESGYAIKLGVVRGLIGNPISSDVDNAMRTFDAYDSLSKYSTVDIELTPNPYTTSLF